VARGVGVIHAAKAIEPLKPTGLRLNIWSGKGQYPLTTWENSRLLDRIAHGQASKNVIKTGNNLQKILPTPSV
jgi:hypothetical protein